MVWYDANNCNTLIIEVGQIQIPLSLGLDKWILSCCVGLLNLLAETDQKEDDVF